MNIKKLLLASGILWLSSFGFSSEYSNLESRVKNLENKVEEYEQKLQNSLLLIEKRVTEGENTQRQSFSLLETTIQIYNKTQQQAYVSQQIKEAKQTLEAFSISPLKKQIEESNKKVKDLEEYVKYLGKEVANRKQEHDRLLNTFITESSLWNSQIAKLTLYLTEIFKYLMAWEWCIMERWEDKIKLNANIPSIAEQLMRFFLENQIDELLREIEGLNKIEGQNITKSQRTELTKPLTELRSKIHGKNRIDFKYTELYKSLNELLNKIRQQKDNRINLKYTELKKQLNDINSDSDETEDDDFNNLY